MESLGELARLFRRRGVDPHLPRRVAVSQRRLLELVILRWLPGPTVLVRQPALRIGHDGVDTGLTQLGFDNGSRGCCLLRGARIHEDRLAVARYRESPTLE